jgi:hypothetical protein
VSEPPARLLLAVFEQFERRLAAAVVVGCVLVFGLVDDVRTRCVLLEAFQSLLGLLLGGVALAAVGDDVDVAVAEPRVLDNFRLWTAIAVVLVILTYALPLWGMLTGGTPGSEAIVPAWLFGRPRTTAARRAPTRQRAIYPVRGR